MLKPMAAVLIDLRWWSEDVHVEMYQDTQLWWFVLGFGEVLQCEKATKFIRYTHNVLFVWYFDNECFTDDRQFNGKATMHMNPQWCLSAADGAEAKECSVNIHGSRMMSVGYWWCWS